MKTFDLNLIPEGMYCYKLNGQTSIDEKTGYTIYHADVCPFWFKNELGYGDCKLLLTGEPHLNGSDERYDLCLDDQCKSCGIND